VVKLIVTSREGELKEIEATAGDNLMEVLRAADLGVLGTCGGMCSCGSCHVYAGEALLGASPEKSEDEQDMLDALSDVIEVRESSRLACQISVSDAMADTELEIAPQI
jgi:2Fe-2S ferredoxin